MQASLELCERFSHEAVKGKADAKSVVSKASCRGPGLNGKGTPPALQSLGINSTLIFPIHFLLWFSAFRLSVSIVFKLKVPPVFPNHSSSLRFGLGSGFSVLSFLFCLFKASVHFGVPPSASSPLI